MKQHLEAFAVRDDQQRTYWTRIGVAFPIKSGGFSILLDAMPAARDGRYTIVARPPKEAEDQRTDEFNEPGFPFEAERLIANRDAQRAPANQPRRRR